MKRTTQLITLAALTIVAAVALATSIASANNLSFSNRNIRIVWESLELENNSSALVRCPITLEGSFHENTVRKVLDTLVGYITRAAIGTCIQGHATVLAATLPWHIRYMGFAGTLPRITALIWLLLNAGFEIENLGFFCLALSSETNPIDGRAAIEAGGAVTSLSPNEEVRIPTRSAGGFGCPETTGRFRSNRGVVTLLGATTAITIRLI